MCVGIKAKIKKCVETRQNQTMGVIFNTRNSHLLTWSSPKEEIFQVHSQNRPVANLPAVDFLSQPGKCHYQRN